MYKTPQAEQINFDVNKIEIMNDYWNYTNDFCINITNKKFLDDLCVKVMPLSAIDKNGHLVARISINNSSADIEIINNDLDPIVNELRRCIINAEKADEPCFFGGDELLEFLLRHKTIEELKEILGDR